MKGEYGSCIVCGRKVKNRVYHKGMLIYICPRHLKSKSKEEVSGYLDSLIKDKSKEVRQYDEMMRSILIIESKITTLSDKVEAWIKIVNRKRLDDYTISRDIMRILDKIDGLTKAVDEMNRSLKTIQENSKNNENYDGLSFLNSLLNEYDMVHYRVEDGIITVYSERNLEPKRFRELNKKLRDRGYAYNRKTYGWIKSVSS